MNERASQQNQDVRNQESLRRLILTVQANSQSLELLIAVCDDQNLQAQIIEQYEADLQGRGIAPFRVRLNTKEPSLRRSLTALVENEPRLQSGQPVVVTVLNAEALLGVTLGEEKSEQERFFFSLQWTREALLRFEFAVVLWVPERIAAQMGRRAPDFWSWRGGVFEFVREESVEPVVGSQTRPDFVEINGDKQSEQSPDVLLFQVRELEESSPASALLITLYSDLGEAYKGRYAYGEALEWYEKALTMAEGKKNLAGQARALRNIGDSLQLSGRPAASIQYYEQGLKITQEIGDRSGESSFLVGLGNTHYLLGKYRKAIDFYQQKLEIAQEVGDRNGEANSLGGLGIVYDALGQYQKAIDFYQQQLEIAQEVGDRNGEAKSLGNLGIAYDALGQYQKAIDFYQRSLGIKRETGDRSGEATSLGNLGIAYDALGQHQKAIDFHQQQLEIAREIGDCNSEAASLGNLGSAYRSLGQYQKAIDLHQRSLAIKHEIGDCNGEATAQFNTGLALLKLNQKESARTAFKTAQRLYASIGLSKNAEDCDEQLQLLNEPIQESG